MSFGISNVLLKFWQTPDLSDTPGYVGLMKNSSNQLFPTLIPVEDITSAAFFTYDQTAVPHKLITQGSPLGWSYVMHDGAFSINTAPEDVTDFYFEPHDLPGQPGVFYFALTATNMHSRQSRPVGSMISANVTGFVLAANFWNDPNIEITPLYFQFVNVADVSPSTASLITCNLSTDGSNPDFLILTPDGYVEKGSAAKNTVLYFDPGTHKVAIARGNSVPAPDHPVWLGFDANGNMTSQNKQASSTPLYWTSIGVWYADVFGRGFGNSLLACRLLDLKTVQLGQLGIVSWENMQLIVLWQMAPAPPSNYDILKTLMVEVTDKTDPNYIACQGGPGAADTQVCFLNHSKDKPTIPAMPQISYNPLEVIGYNRAAVGAPGAGTGGLQRVQGDPKLYLTAPNDAMQLNQMQVSTCLQDDCGCFGQNPDTCKAAPDGYCRCIDSSHQNGICGFQCLPGLEAHRVGDCVYDPVNEVYVSHYQCFPPVVVGTMDANKIRGCCSYVGPAINQPNGPTFNTMEACFEKFVNQCPTGYEYHGNLDRPGCYRVRDWSTTSTSSNHCQSLSDKCGTSDAKWSATCNGDCGGDCNCFCADRSTVPPYGYYCDNGGHSDRYNFNNPKWIQNKSAAPLVLSNDSVNFRFGVNTCGISDHLDNYCEVGKTGYGPDYIGPAGVSRCVNI